MFIKHPTPLVDFGLRLDAEILPGHAVLVSPIGMTMHAVSIETTAGTFVLDSFDGWTDDLEAARTALNEVLGRKDLETPPEAGWVARAWESAKMTQVWKRIGI